MEINVGPPGPSEPRWRKFVSKRKNQVLMLIAGVMFTILLTVIMLPGEE